jgi:segregation and condensation protein B
MMNTEIGEEGVLPAEADFDTSGMLPVDESGPLGTTEPGPEALPEAPLRAVVEALLFAAEEPVTLEDLVTVLGDARAGEVASTLEDLVARYDGPESGLRVQRLAGGFRITTDPALGPFLREFMRSRNRQRLSRAALETLALIAYNQLITAPEIQEIRGVNPSAILSALLERRLIRILGRKKVVGKPFLYGTTREFLIRFGLNALEDLPSMEEFESMIQPEATEPPFDETPPTPTQAGSQPEAPEADDRGGETGESNPD